MRGDVDLADARSAAMEVLASREKRGSARGENPRTAARGMVTPIAKAYIENGLTCRDFLASFVSERRSLVAGRGLPGKTRAVGSL
jgi:hypothetical protein